MKSDISQKDIEINRRLNKKQITDILFCKGNIFSKITRYHVLTNSNIPNITYFQPKHGSSDGSALDSRPRGPGFESRWIL